MKSPAQLALMKAQQQVRHRTMEAWTWEEIELLAELASDNISTDYRVGYQVGVEDGRKLHSY